MKHADNIPVNHLIVGATAETETRGPRALVETMLFADNEKKRIGTISSLQ